MILFENLLKKQAMIPKFIKIGDPKAESIIVKLWDKDKDGKVSIEEALSVKGLNENLFQRQKFGLVDMSGFLNIRSLPSYSFRFINEINKLILPPNLEVIDTCFYGSKIDTLIFNNISKQSSFLWGLKFNNLIIKGNTPPSIVVKGKKANYGFSKIGNEKIYVPNESVELYKQSDSFNEIQYLIHPISEYKE